MPEINQAFRGETAAEPGAPEALEIIAYQIRSPAGLDLVPAWQARDWIDTSNRRFARRCLPMLLANQSGWFLLNRNRLVAAWDGGDAISSLTVQYADDDAPQEAISHFGHGILTWHVPYLFRTPPGWNLLARGPANWPKAGITPLEGVIETDWAMATFTMNWQLTMIDQPVLFAPGEPVCMIVPQRRGVLESFLPSIRPLTDDTETEAEYQAWGRERTAFNAKLKDPGSPEAAKGWQRHYFQGSTVGGQHAPEHQTKVQLAPFVDRTHETIEPDASV